MTLESGNHPVSRGSYLNPCLPARVGLAIAARGEAPFERVYDPQISLKSHIGKRPIAVITPPELLTVLRKIEGRGAIETAHRTKQTAGLIFRYGVATGRTERDVAADL